MKFYLEATGANDEYAYGHTHGVFIGNFCVIGIHHTAGGDGWMLGLVLFNIAVGLWSG